VTSGLTCALLGYDRSINDRGRDHDPFYPSGFLALVGVHVLLPAAAPIRRLRAALSPLGIVNTINVIAPYKHRGMWVFDDPRVGLVQEPFVAGADVLIDRAVATIPDAHGGFLLVFSASPFPGHNLRLHWRRNDGDGGNWYYSPEFGLEGWLCPALFHYFEQAPKEIYVQVKPKAPDT
jgi:hypothetical protein